MKYTFFLLLIFTFSFARINAQQVHFLYFQTETNQPFYIKLDNKILSSTASGYLIVPNLKEGNYKFIVGFPKNEWPEEVINYALVKDAGFLLKNFADKGWGLFDLQSLNVIMPGEKLVQDNKVEQDKDTTKDSFSDMLATVVNDSSIKQRKAPVKKQLAQPLKEKDTVSIAPAASFKDSTATTAVPAQILYSHITKNLQVKNKSGTEMIYTDEYDNSIDTISVLMPVIKGSKRKHVQQEDTIKLNNEPDTSKSMQEQGIATPVNVQEQKVDTTDTSDTSKKAAAIDTSKTTNDNKIEFLPAKAGMINSNCRQFATEDDFLKLRKKMAAENDDDNMIITAKKVFKSKCFTTKDIKNLSGLFLNDSGKYNFFDAAYPYVSDSENFYTLENQLSDEYYIKRFKVMIHQ